MGSGRTAIRGDTPNPAGLLALLRVEFDQGEPWVLTTDGMWKTADRAEEEWPTLEFDDASWPAAKVLGAAGMPPWGDVTGPEDRRLPARYLRKEFDVPRRVTRGVVFLSGLGLSELYVNGSKISDDVLSPALSEYPRRVFYVTYDVTAALRSRRNALGVVLGNGRYYAPRSGSPITTRTYGYPKLRLQLHLEYDDGAVERVVSDESWTMTADGPILANNEYDGEEYDARRECQGWSEPGFDEKPWEPVAIVDPPQGALVAQMLPPLRVIDRIRPQSVSQVQPGDLILWFYEHVAGIQSDPERVGFKHVLMRPHLVGDLQWVKASHRSPYGEIVSAWERDADTFQWQVTIPPNTTATVWIPAAVGRRVVEGGRPLAEAPGITVAPTTEDDVQVEIGSGTYQFIVTAE